MVGQHDTTRTHADRLRARGDDRVDADRTEHAGDVLGHRDARHVTEDPSLDRLQSLAPLGETFGAARVEAGTRRTFVRELFDEPTTILYQVWSLIVTLENATEPGSSIPIEAVQAQADTHDPPYMATIWHDGKVVGELTSGYWGHRVNACIGLGIQCVSPYDMLRRERARFVLPVPVA